MRMAGDGSRCDPDFSSEDRVRNTQRVREAETNAPFVLKSSPNMKGNALQEFTSLMDGCVVYLNPKA